MNISYLSKRFTVFGVISSLVTQHLLALSLILPMEAIYESGRLEKDAFKKKYPGIDVTSDIPDEEGYYVRYTHGNLTYYFGPTHDYIVAEEKSFELQEIVDLATFELPYLKNSNIYVWQFTEDIFGTALNDAQPEGFQVVDINSTPGSSDPSGNNMQGTIINSKNINTKQIEQVGEAQENENLGIMTGLAGQPNQLKRYQQIQEGLNQDHKNMTLNQITQPSQNPSVNRQIGNQGSAGTGEGKGKGKGKGNNQSQNQEQHQSGGISFWNMIGRIFGF